MRNRFLLLFIVALMSACIGVDVVDDPIVDEEIQFSTNSKNLLIDESCVLMPVYLDRFGIERAVDFTYQVEDQSIAEISMNEVRALASGQTRITASYNGVESAPLLVTVVASLDDISEVTINAAQTSIGVDETIQLTYEAKNGRGEDVLPEMLIWNTSNPDIAIVNASGQLTGVSNGIVDITLKADEVESAPFSMQVGSVESLSAVLMGTNGYDAGGVATIEDVEGELLITLSDDFSTDFALGTFLYLSNSTNGSNTRGQGLEVAELTRNGAFEFNLTAIDPSIGINDYQYVIILCKPASITFGYGELK